VTKRLRVAVITDWSHCTRGNHWEEVIAPNHEYTEVRLADAVAPLNQQAVPGGGYSFLQALDDLDVLVLNWDVVNGDPDFGADFTLAWFDHHRGEVLMWVRNGGLLIIEGQTVLSVPSQHAYDRLLGHREVVVCGAEDELDPPAQARRFGAECVVTAAAQRPARFGSSLNRLQPLGERSHEEMFPAAERVASFLARENWKTLYRGWFRLSPLRRRSRLNWCPVIVTTRRSGRRYPTAIAARHGEGAIVATTMFLASTRQHKLIHALLDCHGDNSKIPERNAISSIARETFLPAAISAVAGIVAALIFKESWQQQLLFLLVVAAAVFLTLQVVVPQWGWRWRRALRAFLGW